MEMNHQGSQQVRSQEEKSEQQPFQQLASHPHKWNIRVLSNGAQTNGQIKDEVGGADGGAGAVVGMGDGAVVGVGADVGTGDGDGGGSRTRDRAGSGSSDFRSLGRGKGKDQCFGKSYFRLLFPHRLFSPQDIFHYISALHIFTLIHVGLFLFSLFILVTCSTGPTSKPSVIGTRSDSDGSYGAKSRGGKGSTQEGLIQEAHDLYKQKEYSKAYFLYAQAAENEKQVSTKQKIQLRALRCVYLSLLFSESASYANRLLSENNWTDTNYNEISLIQYLSFEKNNQFYSAFQVAHRALVKFSDPEKMSLFEAWNQKLNKVFSLLTKNELLSLSNQTSYNKDILSKSHWYLGQLYEGQNDYSEAQQHYRMAYHLYPFSEVGNLSKEKLDLAQKSSSINPMSIGLVLPLTGKYSNISQKIIRGLSMGLGLYDSPSSNFKIVLMDSQGNSDRARNGIDTLVNQEKVIAIVGGLLSKTATVEADRCNEFGVPHISLSQKTGITETGNFTFRNALTSEMQIHFLVQSAMQTYGMKRFAILYPNDSYGVEFANLFWDEVLSRGGEIRGAQVYSDKETDFKDVIQRLVGNFYLEERMNEFKEKLSEWKEKQGPHFSKRSKLPHAEELLPPVIDFDAIFIPDGVKPLGQISAMLAFNGVKEVKLLGTNLWNVPELPKRASYFSDQLLFVDSLNNAQGNSPTGFAKNSFYSLHVDLFQEAPGSFEYQGFDTGKILKDLITQGANNRVILTQSLRNLKNFPVDLGALTMSPQREILRPLGLLTLSKGQIVLPQ